MIQSSCKMIPELAQPRFPAPGALFEFRSAKGSLPLAHLLLVAGLLLFSGAFWEASAGTEVKPPPPATKVETKSPPREFAPPKSVFIDDPQSGKDPFFPGSTRRVTKIEGRANSITDPHNLPLTVKLIVIGQSKKLAQINNRNFEPGEQAEVLAGGQKIKLRCLEIRQQSVLVSVEGVSESREILLRPR